MIIKTLNNMNMIYRKNQAGLKHSITIINLTQEPGRKRPKSSINIIIMIQCMLTIPLNMVKINILIKKFIKNSN